MKRSHLLTIAIVLMFTCLAGIAMLDAWDRECDIEEWRAPVPAQMAVV